LIKNNVIAIIPARGGSKGIPKKNIKLLLGSPLIAYTIELAKKNHFFDKVVVSTDSDEISEVSRTYGIDVVSRPSELSGDLSRTEGALIHVLDYYKNKGIEFDTVVTIEATSPMRTEKTINKCIDRFINTDCDSLVTVYEDRSYFWRENSLNKLSPLFTDQARRRQDRKPLYKEAGVIYITSVDVLRKNNSIIGNNPIHYVVDEQEAIDINTNVDFFIVDNLMKLNN
jgi:CMP-N,N'-diacetyllegionaminic acid synthase